MAQAIPRILTVLLGALLAGPLALQWLFAPAAQSAHLGISLEGPAAFSHMRGDTGGTFLAVGALAILGVVRKEPRFLEAVSLVMVCILAGRLLSVALDGYVREVAVAMGVELVLALLAFAVARQLRAAV